MNIYLPSTVCFETNFILLCQYFDIMKNKDELKNIFLMSTKNCTEDRAIFYCSWWEKFTFYIIATSFYTNVLVQFWNNIWGWIKMKERLFLSNTASMLTQRWVLKVCLTVVDIEFKNEIHSSVNLSLPNMYCFLIENTSCCFLLSHYFSHSLIIHIRGFL